jgi:NAD(P)-dependent dehydrogenase (short-subunit alcohol dehydrogenase family)
MADNPFSVDGKVAIITGGGTGIGKAIVTEFARFGAKVVTGSRNVENCQATVDEVKKMGGQAIALKCDVRNPDDCQAIVDAAVKEYGRLDVLVNNHGASFVSPAEDISPNGWATIININLNGLFFLSKAAMKVMKEQKEGGAIINIASMAGVSGAPNMSHYGAAKAGVVNLARTLSYEWAPYNIRVNCIAPGPIVTKGYLDNLGYDEVPSKFTDPVPLKRWGKVEEIAWPCIFLASEASGFMTGETICVDGGPRFQEGSG